MAPIGSSYRPRHALAARLRGFTVATAADEAELHEALELRHAVFRVEWQGQSLPSGRDGDEFDPLCDHIVIRDEASGLLVATMRFNPVSAQPVAEQRVWSRSEFQLDSFLALPGDKVEMGRTCIRKEWRNNATVLALFRGILNYIQTCRATWVFGCCSLDATPVQGLACLRRWLHQGGHGLPAGLSRPQHPDPALGGDPEQILTKAERATAEELLPPLLRTYLRSGAKVAIDPAWDPEFRCWDFLTVFNIGQEQRSFTGRYDAPGA